jgi:pre-mRNA-splicing factor ATP-dependent RNA helicase DHX38/PRP16
MHHPSQFRVGHSQSKSSIRSRPAKIMWIALWNKYSKSTYHYHREIFLYSWRVRKISRLPVRSLQVSRLAPVSLFLFLTRIRSERLSQLDEPAPLAVLPIYSQMPADLQAKIFEATSDGRRKVIVATNIAETSLTGENCCRLLLRWWPTFHSRWYSLRCGCRILQVEGVQPKSWHGCITDNPNQSGKCKPANWTRWPYWKRVCIIITMTDYIADWQSSFCYRLYTEMAFRNELFASTIPEIQRTNLANTVLLLKSLGVKNLLEFDFMDPPPQVC